MSQIQIGKDKETLVERSDYPGKIRAISATDRAV